MKYRKKPIEVEAFRFGHDDTPKWWYRTEQRKLIIHVDPDESKAVPYFEIETPDGIQEYNTGDWLVKCDIGIFPRKHEVFMEFYEMVE